MPKIQIKTAKEIKERLGLTHLVILGVDDDGVQHVATHGKSKGHAAEAARMGDKVKAELGWPTGKPSEPLERVCRNCEYFVLWPEGVDDDCVFRQTTVSVKSDRIACGEFVPKF